MMVAPFLIDNILVIIGLGNPGPKFHLTRHNIGFEFLDYVAQLHHAQWRVSGQAQIATIMVRGKELLLVKPQTFMNSSGDVWPALAKKGIKPVEVLVVHDELEKKFGTDQMRLGGSARGHNGLRSLIARCGEEFWRLRLGVDRPRESREVADYVLARFPAAEIEKFEGWFSALVTRLKLT